MWSPENWVQVDCESHTRALWGACPMEVFQMHVGGDGYRRYVYPSWYTNLNLGCQDTRAWYPSMITFRMSAII